jgi:hypothetical protein
LRASVTPAMFRLSSPAGDHYFITSNIHGVFIKRARWRSGYHLPLKIIKGVMTCAPDLTAESIIELLTIQCVRFILAIMDAQGGRSPSCVGSRPVLAAWSNPPTPAFPPEGKTGNGEPKSFPAAGTNCLRVVLNLRSARSARKSLQPLKSRNLSKKNRLVCWALRCVARPNLRSPTYPSGQGGAPVWEVHPETMPIA